MLVFCCFWAPPVYTSDVAVQVIPSSTYTVIGEKFPVKVRVLKGEKERIENIVFPPSANMIFSKVKHRKGGREDEIDFNLRFLDIGDIKVPGPELLISSRVVRGKPFNVLVKGRLAESETELKKLRRQEGGVFPWWLAAVLAGLFAAAYFFTRRKKPGAGPEADQTPVEWYRRELSSIDRQADATEVLDALSDTFRIYLEKEYGFAAIFLSSSEIVRKMKKMPFSTEEKMKTAAFLLSCDLAKFAKKDFGAPEIEKLFEEAYSFAVMGTPEQGVEE